MFFLMAISVWSFMEIPCFFSMFASIPTVMLFNAKTVGTHKFIGFAPVGSILIFITLLYKDTHRIPHMAFHFQQITYHTVVYQVQNLFKINILSLKSFSKNDGTGIGFN